MYSDQSSDWGGYPPEQQQYVQYPPQHQYPGAGVAPGAGQQFYNPLNNPMLSDMAKQYGENLMGHGKVMVDEKIQKFVSVSKLKYYFAVDTTYVVKKMGLILFPFTHKDWSIRFDKNEDDAIQPRFEVNAPDLYIPLMAFITYILVAGVSLGMQQKFSPEILGIQASSALGWLILELLVFTGCTYVIQTDLKTFDLCAFCSYKFVGMIAVLLICMVGGKSAYYISLGYISLALVVFLIRTLKVQIYSVTSHEHVVGGNKRRLYLLLSLAFLQPFLIWWLTWHLLKW